MPQKKFGICYLCGTPGELTKEHIVPLNLFPLSHGENLWTAPSHRSCNGRLAADEELFRVFVSGQAGDTATGSETWRTLVRKTVAKQPKMRAMFASTMRDVELRTQADIYIGKAKAAFVERERIDHVVKKIVKGLYLRAEGTILTDVYFTTKHNPRRDEMQIHLLRGASRGVLNPPVFRFWWRVAEDDDRASIWWLEFYERARFIVITMPAGFAVEDPVRGA